MFDLKSLAHEVKVGLSEWLPKGLKAVILFGSAARGEDIERSDLDLLVVAEGIPGTPIERCRVVYERLRSVRKKFKRGTSLVVASPAEIKSVTPFLINVAFDGIVLYDEDGYVSQILDRIRRGVEKAGLIRYRTSDGKYGWKTSRALSPGERIVVELGE